MDSAWSDGAIEGASGVAMGACICFVGNAESGSDSESSSSGSQSSSSSIASFSRLWYSSTLWVARDTSPSDARVTNLSHSAHSTPVEASVSLLWGSMPCSFRGIEAMRFRSSVIIFERDD